MNITATAIAVTLAVVVGVAFLFFGPNVLRPFGDVSAPAADQLSMATSSESNPAAGLPAQLPTELAIRDTVVGTGAEAKADDIVTVNYTGALPNGQIFDASARHGEPFTFQLGAGSVIPGWDQGIVGMKVGGKRLLIIPPDLGYGAQGIPNVIPPNSTLIFEVELLKVQ